ncbi:MAG: prepilin-type N-terminal cleavage/methylation domain-containing protein [Candidatus Hydrogenedentes bacterium]|nr:prepilin-type N-terminal cleavage/methylation domain-containing protein [Candidatus Hydrogenedentota bacterium]
MRYRRFRDEEGVTLLELTIAIALFAIVMGATATSLVSYYVALDMQNQRHSAIKDCATILSNMRDVRNTNPDDFPDAITAVWPDGTTIPNAGTLPQETITVDYVNPNANPLEVTITCTWVDMRGRQLTAALSSVLADH